MYKMTQWSYNGQYVNIYTSTSVAQMAEHAAATQLVGGSQPPDGEVDL
jgi:hypothetical protein